MSASTPKLAEVKAVKKILVVEDETALLNVLRDKLTHEGFAVLAAKNGEEGLSLALSEHPDLILLDILLPRVGGLKMLKSLREDTWGKEAQVFVLTNIDKSKEISEGMNYNVAKYIIKSDIKLEDLLWSIKLYTR